MQRRKCTHTPLLHLIVAVCLPQGYLLLLLIMIRAAQLELHDPGLVQAAPIGLSTL